MIQISDDDGVPVVLDAFFRHEPSRRIPLPQELTIYDACIVGVSVSVLCYCMLACFTYFVFDMYAGRRVC